LAIRAGQQLMSTLTNNLVKGCTVVLLSTCLSLFAAEWAYRLFLRIKIARSHLQSNYNYRVTSEVPVEYDAKYGERPKPHSESYDCYIEGGRVIWGTTGTRSNRDGLDGKTTIEEYRRADIKILVFGDSFSHFNQGSDTWPDILQRRLTKEFGRDVAVLDYARGTYGVLQMLDLAADKIAQLEPNLIIIATINDDFTRARWWSSEVEENGIRRFMLSSEKGSFRDYRVAVDQLLIVPEATRDWCEQQIAHPNGRDRVLREANRQYGEIQNEVEAVRRAVPLMSWDHSFLYRRLVHGFAFKWPALSIPRLTIKDYREDSRARDDVRRIRASGVRVMLVYLPQMDELKRRAVIANDQSLALMNSLEVMLNTRFHVIQEEYHGKIPGKIDLLPYDIHPNWQGLDFYATVVAGMVGRELSFGSTAAAGNPPLSRGTSSAAWSASSR